MGQSNSDGSKFDSELPYDGWSVSLSRNTFLGELVGQIPRSDTIVLADQTNARNDKEWHLVVHALPSVLDEHFALMNVKVGERVVISGNAVSLFFNGMDFCIVPFNAIQAILRRQDGKLFVGSKHGADALGERCSDT